MAKGRTKAKKGTSDKVKKPTAGQSLLEKKLGTLTLVKFKIIQGDGKEIEPWKGQAANVMEWMRNSSAMIGETREEIANYWKIEKDTPVYFEDSLISNTKMDHAWFTSEKDGRQYNLAERLVPRAIQPGDRVRLTILGCCSISNVEKA
jgi:hypothetical protein